MPQEFLSIASRDDYYRLGEKIGLLMVSVARVQETMVDELGFNLQYFRDLYELTVLMSYAASIDEVDVYIGDLSNARFPGHHFRNKMSGLLCLHAIMEECPAKEFFLETLDRLREILSKGS